MKQIDLKLNNKVDFDFLNRRLPDAKVRRLVNGLDSFKNISLLTQYFFPPQLIFFDEKLSDEEVRVTLQKLDMRKLTESKMINSEAFNEMKNVFVLFMANFKYRFLLL